MRRNLTIVLACLSLLALAACSRAKPPRQEQQQQQGAPAASTTVPAPQPSGGGLFSSCPQLPLNSRVEAAIKAAMNQIYGPDEANARISVSTMIPGADCRSVTVTYKASGSPATTTLSYDGGTWSVVLFNKHYPVQ